MPVDPGQDPYGAAMLGAMALFGVALVAVFIQRVRDGSMVVGGWMMGVALVGFLGVALAGTAERIAQADHVAPVPAVLEPEPEPEPRPEDHDAGANLGQPTDTTDGGGGGGGSTDEPDPTLEGATVPPPSDEAPPIQTPDPEPDQDPRVTQLRTRATSAPFPEVLSLYREMKSAGRVPNEVHEAYRALRDARATTIRGIMAQSNRVSAGACHDPKAITKAFANLQTIDPRESLFRVARVVTGKLERCRRRYRHWLESEMHGKNGAIRAEYANGLSQRLRDSDGAVTAGTSGKGGTSLRLSGPPLTNERIQSLIESGLLEELENQGFSRVTFSNGRRATQRPLDPPPEDDLWVAELEAQGLSDPLEL